MANAQIQIEKLKTEKENLAGTARSLQYRLKETADALKASNTWNDQRVWKDERVITLLKENNALKEKLNQTQGEPAKKGDEAH